jgi:hypothetical protein
LLSARDRKEAVGSPPSPSLCSSGHVVVLKGAPRCSCWSRAPAKARASGLLVQLIFARGSLTNKSRIRPQVQLTIDTIRQ